MLLNSGGGRPSEPTRQEASVRRRQFEGADRRRLRGACVESRRWSWLRRFSVCFAKCPLSAPRPGSAAVAIGPSTCRVALRTSSGEPTAEVARRSAPLRQPESGPQLARSNEFPSTGMAFSTHPQRCSFLSCSSRWNGLVEHAPMLLVLEALSWQRGSASSRVRRLVWISRSSAVNAGRVSFGRVASDC
jgi:hypothetical protein